MCDCGLEEMILKRIKELEDSIREIHNNPLPQDPSFEIGCRLTLQELQGLIKGEEKQKQQW
jgi:hypothetical protein